MAMAAYKPGRTRNKSKNLPRQKYVIDLSEEEAQEWLDYNIMGGINTNLPGFPIIMYSVG